MRGTSALRLPARRANRTTPMIKLLKFIRNLWRSIFRKRRFAMLNATDNSEEWHMHL